ncbi:MAG: MauE/DoxX family redox-associated membrane protein [Propionibacteriaceae bacterium]|nr:MauE/DoxX family redox-associated membrane protein [Propionibacteriaceae bacterium]
MSLVLTDLVTPVAGLVVSCAIAAVLFWAAQSKGATFSKFTDTVQATLGLSFSRNLARLIAGGVLLLEIAAVVACLAPGLTRVAAVLVAVLGVAFAAAGAIALVRRERIVCNCFGARTDGKDRHLGWTHVALLPVWLIAAAVIATPRPTGAPVVEAATLLVMVAVALGRAAGTAVRALGRLRHERLLFN